MSQRQPQFDRLDFAKRQKEKQEARDQDMRDLESGRRTAQQINEANNFFAPLGRDALKNAKFKFPEAE